MWGEVVGYERALFFFVDASGYAIGQASTLANGSTSAAYVCDDVKTAGLATINPTEVNIEGGDKIKNTVLFGTNKSAPFDVVVSAYDTVLKNMIVGGLTDNTTNSKKTLGAENSSRAATTLLGLALESRYVQSDGTYKYFMRIFPRVQMRWRSGGLAYQAGSDNIIRCVPLSTTKGITGKSFGSAGYNLGLVNDEADNYYEITDNPQHIVTFRGNASNTTFTCTYRPLTTTVTLNATENEMHLNGTATALSSIVTTTGVATIAAAGTAGDTIVLMHQTAFVPV